MNDIVRLCRDGAISAEVALARLVLAGTPAARIPELAADAPRLAALVGQRPDAAAHLARVLDGVSHDIGSDAAAIGALFDRAVALSPEISVAAYSLGDAAVLERATGELLAWLGSERLIWPTADVLDLGCGIGRLAAVLSPLVRSVLGLDVSAGMVREARSRHAGLPNVRFAITPGNALIGEPVDLVIAVDSFPYLVQAGVADAHAAGAAGMLRPGGALVICNLSYRPDPAADMADAANWAARFGLRLDICGARPFQLWDGTAFVLRRA